MWRLYGSYWYPHPFSLTSDSVADIYDGLNPAQALNHLKYIEQYGYTVIHGKVGAFGWLEPRPVIKLVADPSIPDQLLSETISQLEVDLTEWFSFTELDNLKILLNAKVNNIDSLLIEEMVGDNVRRWVKAHPVAATSTFIQRLNWDDDRYREIAQALAKIDR